MALNFLLKRSGTASKRPTAASMALGELDLNYDADTGGVYYKDSNGAVVKVGPCQVSAAAPNATPAGSSGNSAGEFWYDTANSILKVWDGTSWVAATSTSAFLPLAGGTMTGDITFSDAGEGVVFSDASKVDGITDSTSTTDSTIAASATAVKSAYDLANNAIPDGTLTATGDIIYASAASTPARLGIGTNGQYMTVQSGLPAWTNFPLTGYTGTSNTGYGQGAGDSITSGVFNVTMGLNSGTALDTGSRNVAYGTGTLTNATGGFNNVAVGNSALLNLTTGGNNVAVGASTGLGVTTATLNVYVGSQAGQGNSASQNVFVGAQAGTSLTGSTSANSVFVGYRAGTLVSTGNSNIFIGADSGRAITTGGSNTIIGSVIGSAADTGNVILAAGSTIRFQANGSGAWSTNGVNYGTSGQILMSNGSGSAPTWTTSAGLLPNYGEFLSTVSQTNLDTTNGNAATFDTTVESRNVSIVNNSQVTFAAAGTYNIQISLMASKSDAGTDTFYFWFKKNGTTIANSGTEITLQGNGDTHLASLNFIITAAANDYVELWWYSIDANTSLSASAVTGPVPLSPSIILTAVPVGA